MTTFSKEAEFEKNAARDRPRKDQAHYPKAERGSNEEIEAPIIVLRDTSSRQIPSLLKFPKASNLVPVY